MFRCLRKQALHLNPADDLTGLSLFGDNIQTFQLSSAESQVVTSLVHQEIAAIWGYLQTQDNEAQTESIIRQWVQAAMPYRIRNIQYLMHLVGQSTRKPKSINPDIIIALAICMSGSITLSWKENTSVFYSLSRAKAIPNPQEQEGCMTHVPAVLLTSR